ncbi:hypothetical protein KY284_024589 [Solanum tuberosum]|nr:hypothetical protein KY284_024589 [Solanum tuberosum]
MGDACINKTDVPAKSQISSVVPHPLRHYPATLLSKRLQIVPGVEGVAKVEQGVAGVAKVEQMLQQLEKHMQGHMRDISHMMRDLEVARLAVQAQTCGDV